MATGCPASSFATAICKTGYLNGGLIETPFAIGFVAPVAESGVGLVRGEAITHYVDMESVKQ